MTTARDAICRSLCARLADERRTHDELRVMDKVLSGLELGADQYGPLDVARDHRDWGEEAAQECRDLLVYLAARRIAEEDFESEEITQRWTAACDMPHAPDADGNFPDDASLSPCASSSRPASSPAHPRAESAGVAPTVNGASFCLQCGTKLYAAGLHRCDECSWTARGDKTLSVDVGGETLELVDIDEAFDFGGECDV